MNELLDNNNIKLKYPHQKDTNFQKKISLKKEFQHKYKIEKNSIVEMDKNNNLCNYQDFTLSKNQIFLKNFISPNTPYNGLLLYHGMGSGKTCSSIQITEQFRKYNKYNINFKKILIIASPTVQENFKLQLFDETKLKKINTIWKLDGCTGLELIEELNDYNINNMNKEDIVKKIKKIIKVSYSFMGYEKLSNIIQNTIGKIKTTNKEKRKMLINKQLNKLFSESMIVIDEAHNIRTQTSNNKKKISNMLEILTSNVKKMKLLLLTGTPMYNDSKEIVFLINLLNMNDDQKKIDVHKIFDKEGNFIKENDDEIGKKRLIQKSNGYVSYLRGENPYNFPFRIYPNYYNNVNSINNYKYPENTYKGENIDSPLQFLDLYVNTLSDIQKDGYLSSLQKTKSKSLKDDNMTYGYKELQDSLFSLNICYPIEENKYITGKEILKQLMTKTNNKYSYVDEENRIFNYDNIGKYSCKIKSIIDNIINSDGIVLVYSQYLDSGLIPLALALEELGFSRINKKNNLLKTKKSIKPFNILSNSKTDDIKVGKYSMITGNKNISNDINSELQTINSDNNINGLNCKVVLISQAGSEGIDFKNLRQVHILEPWYNLSRIEQIIGRAIRNCSHKKLELKNRNSQIFMHCSYIDEKTETIDMMFYRICENKAIKIGKVQKVLKSISVDCIINYDQIKLSNLNETIPITLSTRETIDYNVKDKPYSLVCDYSEECDHKCINEMLITDNIDNSTYSYNSTIDKNIIKKIKELFLKRHIYKKKDIIDYLNSLENNIDLDVINSSLSYLIDNPKEYLLDKYLRKGNLINIKNMYIFKPVELNKNTTLYDYRRPISSKTKEVRIDLEDDMFKIKKSKSSTESVSKKKSKDSLSKYKKIIQSIKINYSIGMKERPTENKKFYYLYSETYNKFKILMPQLELTEDLKSSILIEHIIENLTFDKETILVNYLFDYKAELSQLENIIFDYYKNNYVYDVNNKKLLFLVDLKDKNKSTPYNNLINNKLKIYKIENNKLEKLKKSEFIEIGLKNIFDTLNINSNMNLNNYISFVDYYDKSNSVEIKIKNTKEISKKNKGRFIINEYPKKIIPIINQFLNQDMPSNNDFIKEQLCIVIEILAKYYNLKNDNLYYLNKLKNKDNYFIKN